MSSNELVVDQARKLAQELSELMAKAETSSCSPQELGTLRSYLRALPQVVENSVTLHEVILREIAGLISNSQISVELAVARWEQQKYALGYADASTLEKMLIENVVVCSAYLEAQQMSSLTAGRGEESLTAAQARYLKAAESLARVRRLSVRTPSLQVNIAQQQIVA